ncbi:NADPH oxidase organizer 1-like [Hippoglossus hippoglossus]|uniref:NADPH oxidase organizer 1-like n=1 Tax=Hippoglossus hippoglossus TaxID=8267 RepID=UPI00148DDB77|nr:NADPH oxidase organizer 1-like [Hippoglossus hippoglossus]
MMTQDQRFVISARIIGAVHRDTPKLKMFMICLLWSDGAEVIIYRSFQDFKNFHRQLKKRFPHMNPFRKNNRVIPKFQGKARKSSLQQKGSRRSIQRMKFLESYCEKLLKCDQTVTQSSEVTQFFMPKDHDLQPDFTKNSVMIMLSDDLPDESGSGVSTRQPAGIVSQPLVTQTHRCVAAYETKDTNNRPFKVAVDEKLDVLIKDPAGWWMVENEEKRLAWFPAPYLELWDAEDDDDVDDARFQLGGSLYCAVRNYSTKKEDEVSVPIGSVVEVLRKSDNGWWLIRFNGKAGYIPSMYLRPYNNPRTGLFNLQRKMHSSTLNLASSSAPQASYSPGTNPEWDSAGQYRGQTPAPGRFHKSQSLDVLSETLSQPQMERDALTSDGRVRKTSIASTESSLSGFSLSSGSSHSDSSTSPTAASRQPNVGDSGHSSPELSLSDGRSFSISSEGSRSIGSDGSEGAPRVPPRPKTDEILTRCTTMTRKAALASQSQLRIQPQANQSHRR